MVNDLLEAQPQTVSVQQLRHDHVELLAMLLRPRLEVRLADVFGLAGEDPVQAFADVREVDVFLGFLPLVKEGDSYGSRCRGFCFVADCPPGVFR